MCITSNANGPRRRARRARRAPALAAPSGTPAPAERERDRHDQRVFAARVGSNSVYSAGRKRFRFAYDSTINHHRCPPAERRCPESYGIVRTLC